MATKRYTTTSEYVGPNGLKLLLNDFDKALRILAAATVRHYQDSLDVHDEKLMDYEYEYKPIRTKRKLIGGLVEPYKDARFIDYKSIRAIGVISYLRRYKFILMSFDCEIVRSYLSTFIEYVKFNDKAFVNRMVNFIDSEFVVSEEHEKNLVVEFTRISDLLTVFCKLLGLKESDLQPKEKPINLDFKEVEDDNTSAVNENQVLYSDLRT